MKKHSNTMKPKSGKPVLFVIIKSLVRLFSPKMTIAGKEALSKTAAGTCTDTESQEPVIIVANHAQMYGPIACELYLPDNYYIWCAGEMMKYREVPAYAYQDFWSGKPKLLRPFYKMLSYLIAPLSVLVFNNARTIAVYKDSRLKNTFQDSLKRLMEGNSIVVFPEHYEPHNHIVYGFQEGFVDIARLYYKRTGKEISFVPMYICPALGQMCIGAPVKYSADAPAHEERARICSCLMQAITDLAEVLPLHRVVPYPNISKKLYPMNAVIAKDDVLAKVDVTADVHALDKESL